MDTKIDIPTRIGNKEGDDVEERRNNNKNHIYVDIHSVI